MTDPGADIEIVVIADAPSGSSGSVFVPVKDPFKSGALLNAALFTGFGLALVTVSGVLVPVASGGLLLGGAFMVIGGLLDYVGNDPPQEDFKRPIRVNRLSLEWPSASESEQIPSEATSLVEDLNLIVPLARGLLDSVERFQGAQNSTDRDWAVRHARGAELLSASSASKYLQLADRLKRFRDVQLDSLELDQPAYEDVRLKAQSGELFPEATKAAFLSGGVTDEELSAIEQSISTSQVETLPVGNFESLRMSYSDKLRDGAHRLIEAMSQSAARL